MPSTTSYLYTIVLERGIKMPILSYPVADADVASFQNHRYIKHNFEVASFTNYVRDDITNPCAELYDRLKKTMSTRYEKINGANYLVYDQIAILKDTYIDGNYSSSSYESQTSYIAPVPTQPSST